MSKFIMAVCMICGVMVWLTGCETVQYKSSERFEKTIAGFEAGDVENPPAKGAIVCIGSSSMRMWGDIKQDMAPLTVIHRGFGGSNMNDALVYTDRIVLPYQPRAVLLYEGDNDIAQKISPRKILATFKAFCAKIHSEYPQCRIYCLSIKPSIRRWEMWPDMVKANQLLAKQCAKDQRLTYIDIATPMLNEEGQPKPDIFKEDNLHMNRKGYEIWRDTIRPVLLAGELKYEKGQ